MAVQKVTRGSKKSTQLQSGATGDTCAEIKVNYRDLSSRREQVTQKVHVASSRTVYLSTHEDAAPGELFVRVKGRDCTSELIGRHL